MAFVAAGWRPAETARRTARLPLLNAWGIHLLGACLITIAITVMVCLVERQHAFKVFVDILNELARALEHFPLEVLLILVAVVLGVEVGFVLLAAMLMPWGARDEPMKASFAHALRVTWLHTAHAFVGVCLAGGIIVFVEGWRQSWMRIHPWSSPNIQTPTIPPAPSPPSTAPPGSQAWTDYQKAFQEHQKQSQALWNEYGRQWRLAWNAYRGQQPWYVRYADVFHFYTSAIASLWFLWALLRAMGTRVGVVPPQRPPMCEFCGYNLSVTPINSRCPECGAAVMDSLGPEVRPGIPCERWRELGRVRAAWRSLWYVAVRPARLGRQTRLRPTRAAWKGILLAGLVAIFLFSGAGFMLIYAIEGLHYGRDFDWEALWIGVVGSGLFAAVCGLLWSGLAATLVAVVERLRFGRNLLPVAMQNAACLGGLLSISVLISALILAGTLHLMRIGFYNRIAQALAMWEGEITVYVWLIPSVVMLLLYFVPLYRATASARYANR
jgi:hypothetical protein